MELKKREICGEVDGVNSLTFASDLYTWRLDLKSKHQLNVNVKLVAQTMTNALCKKKTAYLTIFSRGRCLDVIQVTNISCEFKMSSQHRFPPMWLSQRGVFLENVQNL